MKTIKYLTLRLMAVAAIAIAFALCKQRKRLGYELRRWILCTAGFVNRCLYQLSYQ